MAEKNEVISSRRKESDLKKNYFGKRLRTFSEKSNRSLAFENTFFLSLLSQCSKFSKAARHHTKQSNINLGLEISTSTQESKVHEEQLITSLRQRKS